MAGRGSWAPLLAAEVTADRGGSQELEAITTLVENHRVTEQRKARLDPGDWTTAGIWGQRLVHAGQSKNAAEPEL